jgi:hypothetical protein
MSQKTNKIIVLIALLGVIVLIIISFWRLKSSPVSLSEQELISRCEQELKRQEIDFQICKIDSTGIKFLSESDLDKEIKPSDRFVISVNLQKILITNALNIKSTVNQQLDEAIVSDKPISVCTVLYPVFISSQFTNLSDQEINILLKQYQERFDWKLVSSLLFNKPSEETNVSCTNPFKINEAKLVSFVFSLPTQGTFYSIEKGIVNPDIHQYGLKILLANKRFTDNQLANIDLGTNTTQNYNQMNPLTIFRHWIAFY